MIKSMTGFGKASEKSPYGTITAEIKTLNHKSLSVTCSLFESFFLLEEKLKSIFQGKICRGRVFVKITRGDGNSLKSLQNVSVNENVARDYLKKIKKAQGHLAVSGQLQIQDIIALPGVVESSAENKESRLWPYIKRASEKALTKLVDYRKSEGIRLAKDFMARLSKIRQKLQGIKKHEKQSVSNYKKRLARAMQKVAQNAAIDKCRLDEEVAAFAKNCDISEEITRLDNHIAAYKKTLKVKEADVGKKLDFIAQEMHREANTIGSKAGDYRISKAVIDIKSEIEKMREQVKNVE